MFPEKNRVVNITTLVGKTCKIIGDITTKESIRVDGYVKGNIDSENVASATETAVIDGDIKANEVFIAGKIKGNITAYKSLEMEKTALITGDIFTAKLQIHSGASFNGTTTMGENVKNLEPKPSTPSTKESNKDA
jgi:cytoskeletal protein CcmA (bactofilin family)